MRPAIVSYSAGMTAPALPPALLGPTVWFGPQVVGSGAWLESLSAAEVAEIEAATAPLAERAADIAALTREQFPLPTLAPRLARIRHELLRGRGFVLLRGLPVQRWSVRESATAFFGLGTYLGRARSQNAMGHVLGHVRDLGLASHDPRVRIYQTAERQTFHTDSCDVVGLLCLKAARRGGDSALVSSNTIWNLMRARRPDLAARLLEPVATDRRGEVPAGARPFFAIPVFNWHAGLMSTIYQRQYITSAARFDDAPRLDDEQVQALDFFDALANDPELHFLMRLEPGDLQFVHNHTLLHDRTAFEDWPEPARKRHLLRLWLAPDDARALPPVYAQRYGSVLPGARGGAEAPGTVLNAPLAPI